MRLAMMGELLYHTSFTSRLYINNTVLPRSVSSPCFHLNHYGTLTLTVPVVDDDAGDAVCVPKVNHPPGVFAPVRVWVCAVTSTHVWVGVSVDGPSGWESSSPVSYTLTCRLVVCNITCDNKDNKCMSASGETHISYVVCLEISVVWSHC